jgi:hypothetical protein
MGQGRATTEKTYKGHPFYGDWNAKKTDDFACRPTIGEFARRRAQLDLEDDAAKPCLLS